MPQSPGPEIEAVRVVATGQRWNRFPTWHPLDGHWIVDKPVAVPPPQILDWPGLLVHGHHLEATESLWADRQATDTGSNPT